MIKPPTDNLYKFLAIFGLVWVVVVTTGLQAVHPSSHPHWDKSEGGIE